MPEEAGAQPLQCRVPLERGLAYHPIQGEEDTYALKCIPPRTDRTLSGE